MTGQERGGPVLEERLETDGTAAREPVTERPGERFARLAVVWGIALAWVVIDQIVKVWVLRALWAGDRVVIPGVLWFNLVRNPGAAFGLFPRGQVFVIATSVLLVGVGLWAPLVMGAKRWSLGHIGLGLLVGGGLGNLVDRLFRGGLVVDFIDTRIWPVFNVADIGIVVGTGLVILYLAYSLLRPGGAAPKG